MKKIAVFALCLLLALAFVGCACTEETVRDVDIKVMMADGAPLLTLAKMRSDNYSVADGYNISYTTLADSDALVAALLSKEPDFAIAPINVAAMMHANKSGYRLAAVTIWGIMHIVSNQNVSTLSELKGETIVAFGKSGTPGITLRAILEQNSIEYVENQGAGYVVPQNKVHIVYLAGASDVRNAIVTGLLDGMAVKFGLLAEPVATAVAGATASVPHGQFTARINLQTEWAKNNDGEIYPQAGLIFHERLLEKDADFLNKFIAMTELSGMYANAYPKVAGELCVSLGSTAIPNGIVIQNAMNAGRLPLNFTYGLDAKNAVNTYLKTIYDETPTLIGGRMPSDEFFYGKA